MVTPTAADAPRLSRALLRERYYPNASLGYYVHALPEHSLVYVKNPKVGCSTLLVWLSRLQSGDDSYGPPNIHDHNLVPKPAETGWRRVIQMLAGDAYRFTFVRDPLVRLESAYHDKIVRARRPAWRNQVRRALGSPADGDQRPTFEEFVTALERQDPRTEMDPHWRPQHLNVMHPLVEYDRIGRLESFDADLARIRAEAGVRDIPLDHRNRGSRPDTSVYDGRPDLVRRVRELYATDLELFSY